MEWSLFLLLLMGQFSFSVCHSYEYHFIEENKTWSEARKYCRDHYTDLATVDHVTDLDRVCDEGHCKDGWIGLYTEGNTEGTWFWFSGTNRTSVTSPPQNCVFEWGDPQLGNFTYSIVCDCNENKLVVGTDVKSWLELQTFCSITNMSLRISQKKLQCPMGTCENCWSQSNSSLFSLFRDTWRWSDGSNHCEHWNTTSQGANKTQCVVMGNDGGWKSDSCENQRPFYCYEDELVLVSLDRTWFNALAYCRTNHFNLASIISANQQKWVQKRVQKASSAHVWVGLHYTCSLDLWFWISSKLVCYQNWASGVIDRECTMAGAVVKMTSKWVSKQDTETFNFICSRKTQA